MAADPGRRGGDLFGRPTDTDIDQDVPGEAGEAAQLFDARFGTEEESAREVVVFSHPDLRVDDARYRTKVEDLMSQLRTLRSTQVTHEGATTVTSSERVVASTVTAYDVRLPREQSPFVSPGARAVMSRSPSSHWSETTPRPRNRRRGRRHR